MNQDAKTASPTRNFDQAFKFLLSLPSNNLKNSLEEKKRRKRRRRKEDLGIHQTFSQFGVMGIADLFAFQPIMPHIPKKRKGRRRRRRRCIGSLYKRPFREQGKRKRRK